MRLHPASSHGLRRDTFWRPAVIVAAALVGACSLDSAGGEPTSGATSSTGDAATTGSGASSTGQGPSVGSSSSSGGGDGGGATGTGGSSTTSGGGAGGGEIGGAGPGGGGGLGGESAGGGGAGGEAGSGGSGGVGGGAGGAGGGGGGGGGGPLGEWFLRVYGNDNQLVTDAALSADGAFVYVTGIARVQSTTFEGFAQPLTPNADDIFTAKVAADGQSVSWFRMYGEGGDDQGKAIAVGTDVSNVEHVFLVGTADGNTGAFADAFPGVPNSRWTFLAELDPGDGDVVGGTFWPYGDLNAAADVAVDARGAVAVGTVSNNFTDDVGTISSGDDVIFAFHAFDEVTYQRRLIRTNGAQRGVAIAAATATRGFAMLAEIDAGNAYDGDLPGAEALTCAALNSTGGDDVVLGFYGFSGLAYQCTSTRALGSSNNDHAEAVATDGINAFAALRAEGNIFGGMPGSWIVQATAATQGWSQRLRPNTGNTNILAVSLGGGRLGVAGREADRGFVQALEPVLGTPGTARAFADDTSPARALVVSADGWFVGGRYTGTPDFGGEIAEPDAAIAGDGWIARMAAPQ